ncbi:MAG: purine-nucleoside phosphorylase [Bacteroidetes bacterium]|nr:MAG: purine-nucleoside phosphorylase [Bacteroidota bacterium]
MELRKHIQQAAEYIQAQGIEQPQIGLILGSGLGSLADETEAAVRIPFADIPHFAAATVDGHKGQFVVGRLEGKQVIAVQGRLHYYEGHSMQAVTFPVRVMKALGIHSLIVTNACGGITPGLEPGSLMLITDHINFMGTNPLIGPNDDALGVRFPDMSQAYDPAYRQLARQVANELHIPLHTGIYTAVSGPYYFSEAELRMVKGFGSDTIGMSTVPEVIVARHAGIRVLGISCITDKADPDQLEPLTHERVLEVAAKVRPRFTALVKGILRNM